MVICSGMRSFLFRVGMEYTFLVGLWRMLTIQPCHYQVNRATGAQLSKYGNIEESDMNVVIRNLPDNTSEAEIGELLKEHGVPVTGVMLTNEGDEQHYIAVIALDTDSAGATALVKMLDGKFWRGKTLKARAQTFFTGEGQNQP